MPQKAKCLCQLCSCGRHRCPRNCAMLTQAPQPPDSSEYRLTYIRKPFEPVKSCRPDLHLQLVSEPMCHLTTSRNDYTRHPLGEKVVRKAESYHPTEEAFNGSTNYRTEFIRKPIDPAKPVDKKPKRMCMAPFDGQTSNKTDFVRWPVSYERARKEQEHRPLHAPFDAITMYRTNYITHPAATRQSLKPNTVPLLSCEPLSSHTETKDQFIRHALPERHATKQQSYLPLDCPSADMTMYRQEYMRKPLEPTPSFKPVHQPNLACEPMDSNTTNRCDYTRWELDKRYRHQPEEYCPPAGKMESDTTHRVEFTRKPITLGLAKPQKGTRMCLAGAFDGTTTYGNHFIRWEAQPRLRRLQEAHTPLDAPFQANTSYRNDFIRLPACPREAVKPDSSLHLACAPLETGTEYRKEFIRKEPSPCIAGLIQSGVDVGMGFVQQDAACHKWYQEAKCAA